MILRGWRSAARGVFAAGSAEDATYEAIRACFSFSGESSAYWEGGIEAKAIGVDFRKRQRLAQFPERLLNYWLMLQAWRSATRGVFAAGGTDDAKFGARASVRPSGESGPHRGDRIEARAIAAEKREIQSCSIGPVENHKPLENALAKRERALNKRVERRRAKEAAELEAAIQAINEGRWRDGRGSTAPTSPSRGFPSRRSSALEASQVPNTRERQVA